VEWLFGGGDELWHVVVKAALMYLVAVVALRVGERRTLAQWTLIDFATAVAVGAVVGRTAIAKDQSFLVGALALVTFVAVHRAASLLRLSPLLGKVMDHRLRVLVADGKIRDRELKLCGLTENDLFGQLRQRGIFELDDLRFVFYETKGSISVVRRDAEAENLVDLAVRDSVGYP
jgi:uncharacterized membrane protein YcaP (DUF421 family)